MCDREAQNHCHLTFKEASLSLGEIDDFLQHPCFYMNNLLIPFSEECRLLCCIYTLQKFAELILSLFPFHDIHVSVFSTLDENTEITSEEGMVK